MLTVLCTSPMHLWAQTVFEKNGNIYLRDAHSNVVQMTTSGRGSEPTLSHDGKHAGYLLVVRGLIKYDRNGESLGRDGYLWLVSPTGRRNREIGQSEDATATEFRKANLE